MHANTLIAANLEPLPIKIHHRQLGTILSLASKMQLSYLKMSVSRWSFETIVGFTAKRDGIIFLRDIKHKSLSERTIIFNFVFICGRSIEKDTQELILQKISVWLNTGDTLAEGCNALSWMNVMESKLTHLNLLRQVKRIPTA